MRTVMFSTRTTLNLPTGKIKAYHAEIDFHHLFYSSLPASAMLDDFHKIISTCVELFVPEKDHYTV